MPGKAADVGNLISGNDAQSWICRLVASLCGPGDLPKCGPGTPGKPLIEANLTQEGLSQDSPLDMAGLQRMSVQLSSPNQGICLPYIVGLCVRRRLTYHVGNIGRGPMQCPTDLCISVSKLVHAAGWQDTSLARILRSATVQEHHLMSQIWSSSRLPSR